MSDYIVRKDGRKTILIKKEWINQSGYFRKDIRLNSNTGYYEVFDYNTGYFKYADYQGKRYAKTKIDTEYMIDHDQTSQNKY